MVVVIAWYINYPGIYVLLTTLVSALYIGVIVLNYFGRITSARYLVSLGSPLWVSTINMQIGRASCRERV